MRSQKSRQQLLSLTFVQALSVSASFLQKLRGVFRHLASALHTPCKALSIGLFDLSVQRLQIRIPKKHIALF